MRYRPIDKFHQITATKNVKRARPVVQALPFRQNISLTMAV